MALYRSPEYQTSFESVGLLFAEMFEIDFQGDGCGSRLGILIGMILTAFILQITLILPTRFPVKTGSPIFVLLCVCKGNL